MKKHNILFLLFCIAWLPCKSQNQPSEHKEKIDEFRELFILNNELKTGRLSKYIVISFAIDECIIEIETIDYENSNDEIVKITLPTSGAILKENGALFYKYKAIKETIRNKITKQMIINLYDNSKDIGLLLKFEKEEQYKIMQEKLNELSAYCK